MTMRDDTSTEGKLLVTCREAARMLSVSERTLFDLTSPRGPIPVIRLNGRRSLRYAVLDLEMFVDHRRSGAPVGEPETVSEPA